VGFPELKNEALRTVSRSADGPGMHQATLELGIEGVVSKRTTSVYLPVDAAGRG
jgi:hypothetical protein